MTRPIALVLGTRPEIIKLAPIIRLLVRRKKPFFLIHTGQHYSFEMDRVFFRDLELPEPEYQFSLRSAENQHGDHTGRMLVRIEEVLLKRRPGSVLVQGDTNTVLAGALASAKIPGVRLGHVEAGLRSYDRNMPEEINRILADHASDYCFAPTATARDILLKEGVPRSRIFVTGNTIVDALYQNVKIAKKKRGSAVPELNPPYFLMTLHRQENVDRKPVLASILKGLENVIRRFGIPILFSVHPRTAGRLKAFGLRLPDGIRTMKPVGFLEFLRLEEGARLILTDSGGMQEEACVFRVPCVTLRTTTERPETVEVGANLVAGHNPAAILRSAGRMLEKKPVWKNPFGDGHASEKILAVLEGRRP